MWIKCIYYIKKVWQYTYQGVKLVGFISFFIPFMLLNIHSGKYMIHEIII